VTPACRSRCTAASELSTLATSPRHSEHSPTNGRSLALTAPVKLPKVSTLNAKKRFLKVAIEHRGRFSIDRVACFDGPAEAAGGDLVATKPLDRSTSLIHRKLPVCEKRIVALGGCLTHCVPCIQGRTRSQCRVSRFWWIGNLRYTTSAGNPANSLIMTTKAIFFPV
jgi:hypothetical protein